MKIYFKPENGSRRKATVPYHGCEYAVAPGSCEHCGAHVGETNLRFKVKGKPGSFKRGDDHYTATAICFECGKVVGRIVEYVSNIFVY